MSHDCWVSTKEVGANSLDPVLHWMGVVFVIDFLDCDTVDG